MKRVAILPATFLQRTFVLTAVFSLLSAASAQVTWDGGASTTNWGDNLNWSNDLVPSNATVVHLDSDAPTNISLGNTGRSVDNLVFTSSATSAISLTNTTSSGLISLGSGDQISVQAGSANHSIARTSVTRASSINVNGVSSQVLTSSFMILGSDLSGTNTNIFTKGGAGTLLLSGIQLGGQSRGLVSITGGTLDIRNGLTVGDNLAQNHTQLLAGNAGTTLTNGGGGGAVTFAFGRNSGRATTDAADQTYAGQITGNVNFQIGHVSTLSGTNATNFTGRQTLSGNNTYTGTTTVNQGTLAVNGDSTGQGNYTVRGTTAGTIAKTGALIGTGSIGLANAGIFSLGHASQLTGSRGLLYPGASSTDTNTLSIGTAGNNNDVIFLAGSTLRLDIGTTSQSDRLTIDGDFNIAGSDTVLDLLSLSGAWDGSTYILSSWTGSLTGMFSTVQGLDSGYQVNYLSNSITLSAVPEPSVSAFVLLGLIALLSIRRRNSGI